MDTLKPNEPVVAKPLNIPLRRLSYVRRARHVPFSPSQIYLALYHGFCTGTILAWLMLIPIVHRAHLSWHIITLGTPAFFVASTSTFWLVQKICSKPYPFLPPGFLWYSVLGGFLNNLLSVLAVGALLVYIVRYDGRTDPIKPVLTALATIVALSSITAIWILPPARKIVPRREVQRTP